MDRNIKVCAFWTFSVGMKAFEPRDLLLVVQSSNKSILTLPQNLVRNIKIFPWYLFRLGFLQPPPPPLNSFKVIVSDCFTLLERYVSGHYKISDDPMNLAFWQHEFTQKCHLRIKYSHHPPSRLPYSTDSYFHDFDICICQLSRRWQPSLSWGKNFEPPPRPKNTSQTWFFLQNWFCICIRRMKKQKNGRKRVKNPPELVVFWPG